MAETPATPAKRGRKPAAEKPVKAKIAKAKADVTAASAEIKASARKAASKANARLSEQVVPIKAQATEKARVASEAIRSIDWKAQIEPIREQAGKTAKSAAVIAKDKTGTAMQSLAKLISDTANTVDAKLGPQYGDYARQAAQSVAGAADTLDSKDVDQLMTEARDFVRKSPAVAIGAAAVVGYVLMRLAKGSDE
ncbi:hypothetical protein SAMIE_1014840 [Sphingobium amiense]|uniref:DUF883 domain-containing protein n=1 Tax=Sphingobium amiense TaxID=135719 RepID=A0A494VZY9_9SPHN|nr:hypothetical protein [Sphingobium amiense]BBD97983.1 hypothetical protein SAMIE_1014840 [Sphingobium amiense]